MPKLKHLSPKPQLNQTVLSDDPELLLIQSLRLWARGRSNWRIITAAIRDFMGDEKAVQVLLGLRGLLECLLDRSRSILALYEVTSVRTSSQERAFLTLIAALQAGKRDHANMVATWLVLPAEQQTLVGHARLLADRLGDAGIVLDMPDIPTCAPTPPSEQSCRPVPLN